MTGELGKKMTSNKYFLPAIRIPTRVTYIRSKNGEAQTIALWPFLKTLPAEQDSSPINENCHHLLTLMSFQSCMNVFFFC